MSNDFQTEKQRREQTAPGEGFAVLAVRAAKPGMSERLWAEIQSLMTDARNAAGLVSVDVLQPFDEPDVFVHFEVWASKQAHDAFDAGARHSAFAEQVAPLVSHHDIPRHYLWLRRYSGTARHPSDLEETG